MKEHRGAGTAADGGAGGAGTALGTPGKRSLVEQEYGAIQRKPAEGAGAGAGTASQVAAEGDGHDHGHERDPEPGGEGGADLDTTRPVGGMVPDEIRTALLAEVRRSPRMQQVLREIEEHGGAAFDIKWSARGGFHSGGVIHIDRQDEMPRWISTMMHELNHLNDHRQGLNPSAATSESREDFVNTKMRNEIRSHAISFVGLLEREGSGADPALPPAGFDEFRAHLREREEAEQVCFSSAAIEAMAEQWVEDKYRNEWTTRNTHENYYDYWGRIWDEAHPGGT
jgi:hypothetical protein